MMIKVGFIIYLLNLIKNEMLKLLDLYKFVSVFFFRLKMGIKL